MLNILLLLLCIKLPIESKNRTTLNSGGDLHYAVSVSASSAPSSFNLQACSSSVCMPLSLLHINYCSFWYVRFNFFNFYGCWRQDNLVLIANLKVSNFFLIMKVSPVNKISCACVVEETVNILAMPPHRFAEKFEDVYDVILILDDRENFGLV